MKRVEKVLFSKRNAFRRRREKLQNRVARKGLRRRSFPNSGIQIPLILFRLFILKRDKVNLPRKFAANLNKG